jgi:serine/threonine-protein kinase
MHSDDLDRLVSSDLPREFRLRALLGGGPRGNVYDAFDAETGRRVALRVLAREPLVRAGLAEAVERTIAAAASLDHPSVVPTFRAGASPRLVWYAMEFLQGRTLATALARGASLDLKSCLGIARQTAAALHYAHHRGVVHGDVRPANIFLMGPGWVHLTDFGVSRLLEALPGADGAHRPEAYRAPEETAGAAPSSAGDQYALAAIIRECLAGTPSVGGDARWAARQDHLLPPRSMESRPDLPGHVFDALLRALSPAAADRFPTVLEFASALGAAEVGPPLSTPEAAVGTGAMGHEVLFVEPPPRPARLHLVRTAAAVVVLLGAGEFGLERIRGPEPAPLAPTGSAPAPARPVVVPMSVPPAPALPEPADSAATLPMDPKTVPRTSSRRARPNGPARRPAARVSPRAARAARGPGTLSVSSRPWGLLYLDNRLVGNTPIANLAVAPGSHRLQIVRRGYRTFERRIRVAPRQRLRLRQLVLRAVIP